MPKFYVLNAGMFCPSEWASEKVEVEATSEEAAASSYAAETDEDGDDGRRFEVVVASKEDGSDARLYHGRCNIEVTYDVNGSKPYEVETLPQDDDEP